MTRMLAQLLDWTSQKMLKNNFFNNNTTLNRTGERAKAILSVYCLYTSELLNV